MLTRKFRRAMQLAANSVLVLGKPKIFGIGRNKTGTTSLAKALTEMGIRVGEQSLAQKLIHDWARRDFRRLFWYCHTAQAFQDVPFSWPFTFQALDQHFPGSKFILTVRDDPEQWYHSLTGFYAAVFGNGKAVTSEDLQKSPFMVPGWAYEAHRYLYELPEHDPFNKDTLIASYCAHNAAVRTYFRHRPDDLLVLNVARPGAYDQLCDFLGKPRAGQTFPWENKTADFPAPPEQAR